MKVTLVKFETGRPALNIITRLVPAVPVSRSLRLCIHPTIKQVNHHDGNYPWYDGHYDRWSLSVK